jgi:hypothetical protein
MAARVESIGVNVRDKIKRLMKRDERDENDGEDGDRNGGLEGADKHGRNDKHKPSEKANGHRIHHPSGKFAEKSFKEPSYTLDNISQDECDADASKNNG